MSSFLLLATISAIVFSIQYNSDKVFALLEHLANKFLNWSVQSTSIGDLLKTIKKGLFAIQIGSVFIDLVGLAGFIRAINAGSYGFAICILWTTLCANIVGSFVEPEHKKYYSTFVAGLKLTISLYFDNELNVLSNVCKLLCLLFADVLLAKVKHILLKFGFYALTDEDFNEDSIQSVITNTGTKMINKLETLVNDYSGFQLFENVCKFTCNQIIDKTEEVGQKTKDFVQDVKHSSRHLYKFKLATSFIVFCFLNISVNVPNYVCWSLFMKVLEIVLGATTTIDTTIHDAVDAFNSKCLKIKGIVVGAKASLALITFGVKKVF
jgi:hypothetical protein